MRSRLRERTEGSERTVAQIGEVSGRTGCNIQTIRYYERIGLLPAPPRSRGRYRLYTRKHTERLIFIRRSRDLGFTLDQVRALLALADQDGASCKEVEKVARAHLRDVTSKITDLRTIERVLRKTVGKCARGSRATCPVSEALSGD